MTERSRGTRLAGILLAAWAAGAALIGARGALRAARPARPEPRPLPDFRMTAVLTEGESSVGLRELRGRPWVANFIFTSCGGPCPLLSADMAALQRELPEAVRLISFTVDPDRDDPERLRRYAERFGRESDRWLFLRGDRGQLYKLVYEGFRLAVAQNPSAPEGFRVTHSTKFVLVDAAGAFRGAYEPGDAELRRDARALLSQGGSAG